MDATRSLCLRYKLVKDLSILKEYKSDAVLNGNIDGFMINFRTSK